MFRYINKPFERLRIQKCVCQFSKDVKEDKLNESKAEVLPKKYDAEYVKKSELEFRTPWHRKEGEYLSYLRIFHKEDSKTSTLKWLQTPIDFSPSAIRKWWARQKEERNVMLQAYIPERNEILGNELAAAHFIVFRGGAVKFHDDDVWIKANEHMEYSLPRFYEEKYLQGIDCTDMSLVYEGLENLRDLKDVEWLNLSGCEYIDDWCMDRISNIFSHSLIYLDLRNCPNITYGGLEAVHKLRKLKILYLDDLLKDTVYEMTCLSLQELNPDLDIRSDVIEFEIK